MNTTALGELKAYFGDRYSTAHSILQQHGKDESFPRQYLPECVVFVHSEQDVLKVLEVARTYHVPVTAFAAGSSIEGQVLPVRGGISLDVSGMNSILHLDPYNFCVTCQPGVLYPELSRKARPHGLFFAVDPGADASLGGMASTCASGTGAVKYGTMRDQVLEMKVALISGEVIRVGSKARKSSAGYDLKNLFIGAEGTLGIITELTVKLHPLPAHVAVAKVHFDSVQQAVECAVGIMAAGLSPSRLELVDHLCIRAVNRYKNTTYPETPTLWVELSASSPAQLQDMLSQVAEFAEQQPSTAYSESERSHLWEARHHAFYALKALNPSHDTHTTDFCVPLGALPEIIAQTQSLFSAHNLDASVLGHVGDGNYHVLFHAPKADTEAWQRIYAVVDAMLHNVLAVGGTCTGEHGVGLRKRSYLQHEHPSTLGLMKSIKNLFDPHHLLNPEKILGEP